MYQSDIAIDLDIFHPTMTQWCFSSQILFSLHIWSLYFAEFQFRSYLVPFQKCWLQQNSQLEILMIAVKFYFIIKKFHSSIPQILYHFFKHWSMAISRRFTIIWKFFDYWKPEHPVRKKNTFYVRSSRNLTSNCPGNCVLIEFKFS